MSLNRDDRNVSAMEALAFNIEELTAELENLSLHHAGRDGDFLKPAALRGLLRQMYFCLHGCYDCLRELNSAKGE